MWYCLSELWMWMNEEQFGSMWRDSSVTPPAMILQVILEAVLQDILDKFIVQGNREIQGENRSKIKANNLLKPGRANEGRVEEE